MNSPIPQSSAVRSSSTLRSSRHSPCSPEGSATSSHWEGVRDGVADDAGWTLYLDRFAHLVTTNA